MTDEGPFHPSLKAANAAFNQRRIVALKAKARSCGLFVVEKHTPATYMFIVYRDVKPKPIRLARSTKLDELDRIIAKAAMRPQRG